MIHRLTDIIYICIYEKKVTEGPGENEYLLLFGNSICTTFLPNFNLVNLQHCICKHVFSTRVEISVDPNQMAWVQAS